MKKVGILTGGGDCPGLNAVIRGIVRKAYESDWEAVGIREGWRGMLQKKFFPLTLGSVSGILPKGGTILGTSRTNPFKKDDGPKMVLNNFKELGLDALIAIGGEDTLGVAAKMVDHGLKVVGAPKTIDNDLSGTDFTIGFDTAVNIVTEAIDRLHTTAESHNRVMIVEVMGRHAGWVACFSGIAGGADFIMIPEKPAEVDEICSIIKKRHERGKNFSIVVVAEGAKLLDKGKETEIRQSSKIDEFGHVYLGGVGSVLAEQIEKRTGFETRVTVLGHTQRGGTPSAFDRILGTAYGVKAMEIVLAEQWGKMPALTGGRLETIEIKEAVKGLKLLSPYFYDLAKVFFG
jgi:ATP-dependent phosphofructokinase / diphosphate-dependent phosphofructokinase